MKKSQILAALALAFALGVVAPVAGLANNASAYNEEKDLATYNDVTNSIAFVENDSVYKAYVQIQDAIRAYEAGKKDGSIDNLVAATGKTQYSDVAYKLWQAIGRAGSYFGYNKTNILNNDMDGSTIHAEQAKSMISAAKTSVFYNKFAAVIDLVKNAAENASNDAKLISAVDAIRTYAYDNGIINKSNFDGLHPEEATIAKYKVSNAVEKLFTNAYPEAEAIFNAVQNAEKALEKFDKGYDLFMPLLANSGLLKSGIQQNVEDAYKNNKQPSWYFGIANDSNSFVRSAQLKALYDGVQTAKAQRVREESGDNFSVIRDLATAWKAATGNEQAIKTVMARMAAYKAPVVDTPADPDTPLKPGNTGLVGSAEGTATTVSIVAGLATALTALGAGVVVYRNARREK